MRMAMVVALAVMLGLTQPSAPSPQPFGSSAPQDHQQLFQRRGWYVMDRMLQTPMADPILRVGLRGGSGGESELKESDGLRDAVIKARKNAFRKLKFAIGEDQAQDRLIPADEAFNVGDLAQALEILENEIQTVKSRKPKGSDGKPAKAKPSKPRKSPKTAATETEAPKAKLILSNPKDNLQAKPRREDMDESCNYAANSPELLEEFLTEFGVGYRTRFPPEPNGFLHIGHAKAIHFNFGQARLARAEGKGGETILRFDDTNPEVEDQRYVDAILDDVAWLGMKPVRVTYTSDYFPQMFELALKLIGKGLAYVCHQTADEMRAGRKLASAARIRGEAIPLSAFSPWRNTTVEENYAKFMQMKGGSYSDGEVCLRMKGHYSSDNPAMWDPVFYRIKHSPPHARSGCEWKIYPTYDFSHCIVDSLEGITHSCCTLEFASRQAPDGPYYWLLWALNLYKPATWEYSRCNVAENVLSKRRLQQLVRKGIVEGWDDPRLLTIAGLRRRGYSPGIIQRFCEQIGVSTSQDTTIHMHVLEAVAREEFDTSAQRVFAVLEPLKVSISNWQDLHHLTNLTGKSDGQNIIGYLTVKNHPKNESHGTRQVPLSRAIYIESKDFRADTDDDFFGLVPNGAVGLLGAGITIICEDVIRDAGGHVIEIVARAVSRKERKPKSSIHWIAEDGYTLARIRTFGSLLISKEGNGPEKQEVEDGGDPGDEKLGNWLETVNPNSVHQIEGAMLERSLDDSRVYQFMRSGYYISDSKSSDSAVVFHQIVPLKSSYTT